MGILRGFIHFGQKSIYGKILKHEIKTVEKGFHFVKLMRSCAGVLLSEDGSRNLAHQTHDGPVLIVRVVTVF